MDERICGHTLRRNPALRAFAPVLPGQRRAPSARPALRASNPPGAARVGSPPPELIALHRTSFGPRPAEVERMRQMGIDAYLEEQLHPETIADTDCDARIQAADFRLLDATLPVLWRRAELEDYEAQAKGYYEVLQAAWTRTIYSRRQLHEVLVDHWHNHFNVYGFQDAAYLVWPDHDRRIRRNVLGNFRTFLEDIATSPAMLFYLDNASSSDAGPNENYARELLELHTLGVAAYTPGTTPPLPGTVYEGYRDWDVLEVARCLTGWSVDDYDEEGHLATGRFLYRPEWHDRFAKYVFNEWIAPGQAPQQDGRDVLDRIARHPATARNVVTRLARRLVSDTPSESLLTAGIAAFLDNLSSPEQLRHVTRALLQHPDFTGTWAEKIRRPHEMLAYSVRATEAQWTWNDTFGWFSFLLGQPLFEWPAPNGYPDRRGAWSSSSTFVYRWTFFNYLCENWLEGLAVDIESRTPAQFRSARQLVDFWAERVLGYRPQEAELVPLYDYMGRGSGRDDTLDSEEIKSRLPGLVSLVLSSPAAQVR